MTAFVGPMLAAALIAQFQGGTLDGAVVDEAGKPIADAQVLFFAPAPWAGNVRPVEVRARTDAGGRFRLTVASLTGVYVLRSMVWAYRAGSGIAAAWGSPPLSRALVLRPPKARTIKVEGPQGQPIAGALVSPRIVSFDEGGLVVDVPEALAGPLAVTTGPDGSATLGYLGASDLLAAVRITADSVGTQDIPVIERPGGNGQGATLSIRLKPTSRLSGRVRNRAGQPVANQAVGVWFEGGSRLEPSPVGFKSGRIVTAADGSFQTPFRLRCKRSTA